MRSATRPPYFDVAPYVGAWIETSVIAAGQRMRPSHPTWVRGLKQTAGFKLDNIAMSHPTWVRGLKQFRDKYDLIASKGRTLRGCVD